ncbi:hypothetical protein FM038_001625 [Shewanella eurypsychrophilus]|uniref:Uncharacterized protein n=1 Tax=Shewanella eurypsychrophilus TaxID=2593656 RepID=A0ABX6V0X2_9GAMM|nr:MULTISPECIES: DUF6387 family protein [Shewanella]QFU20698.1 hypothetical protein FS418_01605 [Shewanella sp. YLB-09]QFU20978.1 hypothetical protein FS418_03215 [Shewanella sp. YLB-09]QPG56266.1 hypothetical protein FM038_001625 [Shewanella eurypsychrophilus]
MTNKVIDCASKLQKMIPWFQDSRYSVFNNADLQYIADELLRRIEVFEQLKSNEYDTCLQQDLFSDRSVIKSNEEIDTQDHFDAYSAEEEGDPVGFDEQIGWALDYQTSNVSPVSIGDMASATCQISHQYQTEIDSLIEVDSFEVKNNSTFVWLNLANATNAEIEADLSERLQDIREKFNLPEPKRGSYTKANIKRLKCGYFFKYIDLYLWAKAYGYEYAWGKKIEETLIKLPPEINDPDYVSNTLRPRAKELLKFSVYLQLTEQIKKENRK